MRLSELPSRANHGTYRSLAKTLPQPCACEPSPSTCHPPDVEASRQTANRRSLSLKALCGCLPGDSVPTLVAAPVQGPSPGRVGSPWPEAAGERNDCHCIRDPCGDERRRVSSGSVALGAHPAGPLTFDCCMPCEVCRFVARPESNWAS